MNNDGTTNTKLLRMHNRKTLEICCYTVESAVTAERAGADRVELCDNYPEGGTTPSCGAVQFALESLNIPVNVMVRPRGGDFLYTEAEYEIMKKDVLSFRALGANGIVAGILTPDGDIDLNRTAELVELASPLEVTFHRAFDMCREPLAALEQLKDTGITRILTSGAKKSVMEGIDLLGQLVRAAGDDLSVMPGCGVNENTLPALIERTGAREYHSAAQAFQESRMEHRNREVSMGGVEGIEEYKTVTVDAERIRAMARILHDGD